MTDGDALWQAVVDEPYEDLPRLALADWLDEQESNEESLAWARFIRLQILEVPALASRTTLAECHCTPRGTIGRWLVCHRCQESAAAAKTRETQDLLRQHGKAWCVLLFKALGADTLSHEPTSTHSLARRLGGRKICSWEWEAGFPAVLEFGDPLLFHARWREVANVCPVRVWKAYAAPSSSLGDFCYWVRSPGYGGVATSLPWVMHAEVFDRLKGGQRKQLPRLNPNEPPLQTYFYPTRAEAVRAAAVAATEWVILEREKDRAGSR